MGTVSFLSSVCVHQVRECALNSEETMRLFPLYLMFLVSLVSGAPSDFGQFGAILDDGLQIISPALVGVAPEGKVDAYKKMADIGYKLVEAQKKVMKDVVEKKVEEIEKKVEEIEDEIDKIQSKELEARKKTLLMIKKSRKDFQIIRRNLEGLASETVRRVDDLVLIINSDAVSDEEKFELEVERMISLMKRSREVIETSVKRYHEIDESLTKAHNELKALKYFIEDLIREGNATKDTETLRKGIDAACGTATAVVATTTLTQSIVDKWVSRFNSELEADIYEYLTIETYENENEIQNAFEDLDADGNKLISKDELQKKATTSRQEVEGVVSDLTQYILSKFVEKTIKKVDIDGDGQINFEEYQKIKKKSV